MRFPASTLLKIEQNLIFIHNLTRFILLQRSLVKVHITCVVFCNKKSTKGRLTFTFQDVFMKTLLFDIEPQQSQR